MTTSSETAGESLRQNPGVAWREIDGQAVLVDTRKGALLELNAVGLFIWQRLERPATRGELRAALTAHFEVDESRAGHDLERFLGELLSRGLVESAD